MADVTINYKGSAIAEMPASGTKTIKCKQKYMEDDISIVYEKPAGVAQIHTVTAGANNCSRINECYIYLLSLLNLNFPTKYILDIKSTSEQTTPNAVLNHTIRFIISNAMNRTYYKRYRNSTFEEGFINTVQETDFVSAIAEGTTYEISLIELEE